MRAKMTNYFLMSQNQLHKVCGGVITNTVIDASWLEARIARTKELIVAYENAIDALASGAQNYTLDTGQTRQVVQRAQLGELRNMLDSLENRLATLCARAYGASFYGRPGF